MAGDKICACGHPRSAHTIAEIQRFTDGSVRRRVCAETMYDGWNGIARVCMCDIFAEPVGGDPQEECQYCWHPRSSHAVDGCHATTGGVPWRPGDTRCNCSHFPGQPTLHRWRLTQATRPHARCARVGYCVEHAADPRVESCS